jgi:hypothetical protein
MIPLRFAASAVCAFAPLPAVTTAIAIAVAHQNRFII